MKTLPFYLRILAAAVVSTTLAAAFTACEGPTNPILHLQEPLTKIEGKILTTKDFETKDWMQYLPEGQKSIVLTYYADGSYEEICRVPLTDDGIFSIDLPRTFDIEYPELAWINVAERVYASGEPTVTISNPDAVFALCKLMIYVGDEWQWLSVGPMREPKGSDSHYDVLCDLYFIPRDVTIKGTRGHVVYDISFESGWNYLFHVWGEDGTTILTDKAPDGIGLYLEQWI